MSYYYVCCRQIQILIVASDLKQVLKALVQDLVSSSVAILAQVFPCLAALLNHLPASRAPLLARMDEIDGGKEMQRRLKAAGAKRGDVTVSLMWSGRDDLDLHVTPPSGEKIWYNNRRSACQGELDIDANRSHDNDQPVENIYWPTGCAPSENKKNKKNIS
jgi:hypothetical protein